MKSAKRKIITGAVFSACVAIAVVGGSIISGKAETVPASIMEITEEPPVIVLDAGHGGFDGGCVSAEGVPEKGINLSILLRLRDMLELNGYKVEVTRDTDISIHDKGIEGLANQKSSDMDNRLEIFNKNKNAVCISIHQNQFTDPIYSGAQMFYSATDSRSETLAKSLQDSFRELIQPENDREIKLCGKELFLCYFSENPTVMVECGFLSNPEEAALLNTGEYQQKVAMTIFKGLTDYLNEQ
ncbi:MAG: N-acetylmuramoyl-L-alanine amidase [Ruminococcus sp.]|nr:N-acetylmuramoyl-L-alanine amidase [Ruminococcus sp.]